MLDKKLIDLPFFASSGELKLDYTVIFINGTDIYEIVSVNVGQSIKAPIINPTNTNPNLVFNTWKLDGNMVEFPYIPTRDVTIYADFIYGTYCILHLNDNFNAVGTIQPTITNVSSAGVKLTFKEGKFEEAFSAVSNSAFLIQCDDLKISSSDSFSIECWVKYTGALDRGCAISLYGGSNGSGVIYLRPTGAGVYAGGAKISNTSSPKQLNTWYHLYLSANSSTVYLFVDGQLMGSCPRWSISTDYIGFGGNVLSATYAQEYMTGAIDEIKFYIGEGIHTTNFTPPTDSYN